MNTLYALLIVLTGFVYVTVSLWAGIVVAEERRRQHPRETVTPVLWGIFTIATWPVLVAAALVCYAWEYASTIWRKSP